MIHFCILYTIFILIAFTSTQAIVIDIIFAANVPLGMQLSNTLEVLSFSSGSMADAHGVLKGDILMAVNGESVKNMPLNNAVYKLKEASLPKTLSFESSVDLNDRPHYVQNLSEANQLIPKGRVTSSAPESNAIIDDDSHESPSSEKSIPNKEGLLRVLSPKNESMHLHFAQAAFGTSTTCQVKDLAIAKPLNGCGMITNAKDVKGKYIVMERGDCTFVEKSSMAVNAGAVGIVIINRGQQGTFSMPSGGSSLSNYINIPAIMVSYEDGEAIKGMLQATNSKSDKKNSHSKKERHRQKMGSKDSDSASPFSALAQMAAFENCDTDNDINALTNRLTAILECAGNSDCTSQLSENSQVIAIEDDFDLNNGGEITIKYKKKKLTLDFLKAKFGGDIIPLINTAFSHKKMSIMEPILGCQPPLNRNEIEGSIVLVERGKCSLTQKIKHIQEAGGAMVIIINMKVGLEYISSLFGQERGIIIPSIMVTKDEGRNFKSIFRQAYHESKYESDPKSSTTSTTTEDEDKALSALQVKAQYDIDVQRAWSQLRGLIDSKEAWPKENKKRHKFYKKMSLLYHPDKLRGSVSRNEAVQYGYRAATYWYSPELQSKFDFDVYMDSAYN